MDILLKVEEAGHKNGIDIFGEDSKKVRLECYMPLAILEHLVENKSIANIYEATINALKQLWIKKDWPLNDLDLIYFDVIQKKYKSDVRLGSLPASPDKRTKLNFVFEVYPDIALYLIEISRKDLGSQTIKFFEGDTILESFLTFFTYRRWLDNNTFALGNSSKEIFFIFNVLNSSFSIEYNPTYLTIEQCKNQLKSFKENLTVQQRLQLLNGDSI